MRTAASLAGRVRPFRDRSEAGAVLATKLTRYAHSPNVIVLGLARGGVPVAYEIARALGVPFDSYEVRKIGTPGHEELAMGAIASGGACYLNTDVIGALHVSRSRLEHAVTTEQHELERREKLTAPAGRGRLSAARR